MTLGELNSYSVEVSDDNSRFTISGEMRLHSPLSYSEPFSTLKESLEGTSCAEVFIDIEELEYLNSSGITSFARLILLAAKYSKPLTVRYSQSIPWQAKNITSLLKLYPQLI